MRIILASTSPYRRDLLSRLGLPFDVATPDVDENFVKARAWPPRDVAVELSRLKAESVAAQMTDGVVIGCDQVVDAAGVILDKPGTKDRAAGQLRALAGTTFELHSATTFIDVSPGGIVGEPDPHCVTTSLTMRPLTDPEIDRYLDLDEPYDCAGSFRIEKAGIALFEQCATADFTAIVGLPMMLVARDLREREVAAP
ncbi:MAG: nucleoside triphosphate pyrophosphatase [Planctomycetota bacterium]